MNQPKTFHGENDGDNHENEDSSSSPQMESFSARESIERDSEYQLQPIDDEPVVAEVVNLRTEQDVDTSSKSSFVNSTTANELDSWPRQVDLAVEFRNMSAIGGAVGGFVLGLWSIICSMITYFGFINAILAIVLGVYGLRSSRKKLAMAGIILGVFGLLMSLMEINEMLGKFFTSEENFEL